MRLNSRVFLLIAVLMLSAVCVRCGGPPRNNAAEANGDRISREQAALIIEKISGSSAIEDIETYPEMDREIDDILYYYIRAIYENGMSAAYFVDAAQGNVFVAVGGELDIENPVTAPNGYAAAPEALNGQTPSASEPPAIAAAENSVAGELAEAIGMTETQVQGKFGKGYKDFSVSYDGYMKAYYYMQEGFIVAFSSGGAARYIYCTDAIDVQGAKAGMSFAEIRALLGDSPIYETWTETPENRVYEIRYSMGPARLVFFSHQKDGSHSILRIG